MQHRGYLIGAIGDGQQSRQELGTGQGGGWPSDAEGGGDSRRTKPALAGAGMSEQRTRSVAPPRERSDQGGGP